MKLGRQRGRPLGKSSFILVVGILVALASAVSFSAGLEEKCASCHAEQVKDWQQSHHFHAMEPATPQTVLGDFTNQTLNYQGATATFTRQGEQLFISMPGLDGKLQTLAVAYTFGYEPLQQYMFDAGKGKYQFFPFAWDSRVKENGGQRWFVLHPEQTPSDEFHWSNMGQNWNQMCADCHSTDFRKGFDLESQSYHSTYSAVNVSCAACHGSAEQHLKWAEGDKSIADKGYSTYIGVKAPLFRENDQGLMQAIADIKPSRQVQVCASCHSRRSALADSQAPDDYHNTFEPALITEGLYHADGQIWDEDYVWGSFLQSKMHEAGVTCSNCHNPHSGQIKLPGNQVCTQCHTQETYEDKKHHGHTLGSIGSACVDCHMPSTTYMQIDARRDHSFKVPRPDLSQSLGVPNACNGCHKDKSAKWSEANILQWHPESNYLGHEHFATAFHKGDTGAADAGQELTKIAQDPRYPDIIRASALHRMARTPGQNAVVAIARAVRDGDPIKRQAAIEAASAYPTPDKWRMLSELLDDTHLPVRTQAARSLARMLVQPQETALDATDSARLRKVLDEYREVQAYQADRGFAHTNLGNLEHELGRSRNAEKHYRKAIEVEPIFMPAYVNLADLYRIRQNEAKVQEVLQQALAINEGAAAVRYAMAMSYIRQGDKPKALPELKAAASGADASANFIYTYGLLLQDMNRIPDAIVQLQKAYEREPGNPDISYTLSQLYAANQQYDRALFYAKKLNALVPGNQQIQQMLRQLEQQQKD
ncbi:tetratricopeptide repeat protein [Gilvimarinus agarilyticus]|uniref:tetratricopeptide repeat protein n=1 Tax=Gilvimarinus agarilyticus TaxID=679259 RepID=UPI0005A036AE|nr:tetratricopeptide repeat protein [Gilvimarinus agarilyticus]